MARRWFYTCGGLILGPCTVTELRVAVVKGVLGPLDLVWPEDGGRARATTLAAALKMPRGSYEEPPAPLPPDWVDDVKQAAPAEPTPTQTPPAALPDWLSDIGDPHDVDSTSSPPSNQDSVGSPGGAGLPDWLADMQATLPADSRSPAPPRKSSFAQPTALPPAETPDPPASEAIPLARRAADRPVPNRHDQPTLPEHTGPTTPEQIYDAACVALRRWVDAPHNRSLITSGDLEVISPHPVLQHFFTGVQRHSLEMADRLRLHLQFLVDNRRKFYRLG